MTKTELVAKLSQDAGVTKVVAEKMLASFMAAVVEAAKAGDKVTLVGFGTFSALQKAARTGRSPRTGQAIKIPAKKVVKFSPGKALKDLDAKPAAKAKAKPAAKAAAKPAKKK